MLESKAMLEHSGSDHKMLMKIMKPTILSDSVRHKLLKLLSLSVILLSIIFSPQMYDVIVQTYQVMHAHYSQDSQILPDFTIFSPIQNISLCASELEAIQIFMNGNIYLTPGNDVGLKVQLENTSICSVFNGTMSDIRSLIDNQGLVGLSGMINDQLADMGDHVLSKCILGSTFSFDEIREPDSFHTLPGGEWQPLSSQPSVTTAVIIPFRNRDSHLRQLIPYLHSFLQKQQLHYRIYVIEQHGNSTFNKAKLMNVGYMEASKDRKYDCYVFNDVDSMPLDERIWYNCSQKGPLHMAPARDEFGFEMPYKTFFGGVTAFTEKQLRKTNGFSNNYLGWGGEDDDMELRVRLSGQDVQRYPIKIARYHTMRHGHDKGNEPNPQRFELLQQTKTQWRADGLNSLSYNVIKVTNNILYTNISVNVT